MPRSGRVEVEVEGLRDFIKDLGIAERYMDDAEILFESIAAASVIVQAKELAHSGTHMQQQVAATDMRRAGPGVVEFGGHVFSFGAEFGALQWKQFEMWRGNDDGAGYFLWPAVRHFRDREMMDSWVKSVYEKVIKPAFPNWG